MHRQDRPDATCRARTTAGALRGGVSPPGAVHAGRPAAAGHACAPVRGQHSAAGCGRAGGLDSPRAGRANDGGGSGGL